MHPHAAGFGDGGKQKVGTHRDGGFESEQEDQQWRHQRTAAYAGQTHQQPYRKTGKSYAQFIKTRPCFNALKKHAL